MNLWQLTARAKSPNHQQSRVMRVQIWLVFACDVFQFYTIEWGPSIRLDFQTARPSSDVSNCRPTTFINWPFQFVPIDHSSFEWRKSREYSTNADEQRRLLFIFCILHIQYFAFHSYAVKRVWRMRFYVCKFFLLRIPTLCWILHNDSVRLAYLSWTDWIYAFIIIIIIDAVRWWKAPFAENEKKKWAKMRALRRG